MLVRALKNGVRYARKTYRKGTVFDMPEKDVKLFLRIRLVEEVDVFDIDVPDQDHTLVAVSTPVEAKEVEKPVVIETVPEPVTAVEEAPVEVAATESPSDVTDVVAVETETPRRRRRNTNVATDATVDPFS